MTKTNSSSVTRRAFLAGGMSALVGCRMCDVAESKARGEAERYVSDGLFSCLVAGSNLHPPFAVGRRTLGTSGDAASVLSRFDLASVGKTQTASLCALLAASGKLDVDAPFTKYLPEHVLSHENCRIRVRDLATHSGGFDNTKSYLDPDPSRMFAALYAKRPVWRPGERFAYACSNFIYLGLIVERLTGLDLDTAARQMLWNPLCMSETTWQTIVGDPDAVEFHPDTYGGTPYRRIGEHNDLTSHLAPRPMGNGSCFSTFGDMLRFVTDLLRRETFPEAYYDLLFTPSFCGGGHRRSFGWDMTAPKSTFGDWTVTSFSDRAICHSGWTGSVIAVDPQTDFAGVVLAAQMAGKERTMGPRLRILDLLR